MLNKKLLITVLEIDTKTKQLKDLEVVNNQVHYTIVDKELGEEYFILNIYELMHLCKVWIMETYTLELESCYTAPGEAYSKLVSAYGEERPYIEPYGYVEASIEYEVVFKATEWVIDNYKV